MKKVNWQQLSDDAGGPWLGNPAPYYWLAPIWVILSVLLTPHLNSWAEVGLSTISNVLSLTLCAGIFWILLKWPFRNRAEHPVALGWVMVAGAAIGCVKGLATVAILWLLRPDFNPYLALPGKVLSVTFFGLWLLPTVSICYGALARYRLERSLLIAEIVHRETRASASEMNTNLDLTDVHEFVRATRSQLSSHSSNQEDSIPELLDTIVERELRPLSHRIWEQVDSRITDFTIRDLARVMFREHQYPTVAIVVAVSIMLAAPQIIGTGWIEGILRLVVQAAIITAVIEAVKRIPVSSETAGWAVFVAMNIIATTLITVVCTFLFGDFPTLSQPVVFFLVLNVVGLTTLIFGISRSALKERDAIREQLNENALLDAKDVYSSTRDQLERRELAHYLHGHVQNRMLSAALRIRSLGDDSSVEQIAHELTSIDSVLEDLLDRGWTHTGSSLPEELHRIHSNWNGLIKLNITNATDSSLQLSSEVIDATSQVVNEAITNAVRHGLASHITVDIRHRENALFMSCIDDGQGVHSPKPGLGTALYDSVAGHNWSLTPRGDSTGTVLHLVLQI